jgi:hypothetical protein
MGVDNLLYIGVAGAVGVVGVLTKNEMLAGYGAGAAVGYLTGKLTELLGAYGYCFGGPPAPPPPST